MKRVSFSVDIYKCEEKKFIGNKCKDDTEIIKLLQQIYFTFYTLTNRVSYDHLSLKNSTGNQSYPYITKEVFHSQFRLKIDEYRDNNNFMRINEVDYY